MKFACKESISYGEIISGSRADNSAWRFFSSSKWASHFFSWLSIFCKIKEEELLLRYPIFWLFYPFQLAEGIRICCSRQLLKHCGQRRNFLLWAISPFTQCFQIYFIITFICSNCPYLFLCFQSCLLQFCCRWKRDKLQLFYMNRVLISKRCDR